LPLCFAYAGEYAPKRIRGRILACIQLLGGAIIWPISTLFALFFLASIGSRGIWFTYGIGALVVFVLRFSFPESPRWLATHGRGTRALEILDRMGIARPDPGTRLFEDAASHSRSDPFLAVFRDYPGRVVAASICFIAFFGVAPGLGAWLPNIIAERGLTITKTIKCTLLIQVAYPSASIFMMFALERFGRKPVAIVSFFSPVHSQLPLSSRQTIPSCSSLVFGWRSSPSWPGIRRRSFHLRCFPRTRVLRASASPRAWGGSRSLLSSRRSCGSRAGSV
jgi:MFS transporter, putative metabolite:H+ symporter